jgi:methionyl-tRNA formyltransferase
VRLLIFTDVNSPLTGTLVRAALEEAVRRPGVDVCGIVTCNPRAFFRSRRERALALGHTALAAAADRGLPPRAPWRLPLDPGRIRRRVPVLVAPGGDPNAPAFRRRLARELRPTVALSFWAMAILRPPLLETFEHAVNFHDGLLPRYRGLRVTAFSIYHGEPHSGYAFHHMTERVDAGPVLVDGTVPLQPTSTLAQVLADKGAAAADALPRVLDLVAEGAPGRPQEPGGSYFAAEDVRALVRVSRPEDETADELRRRTRAFGRLDVTIGGRRYPVTRWRNAAPGERLAFTAADGATLAPARIQSVPPAWYLARQRLRNGGS